MRLAEHLVDALLEVENASICSQCKGACCKGYPGVTSPEDWGAPDVDEMRRRLWPALKSERWLIDYWAGSPADDKVHDQVWPFVRPATKSGYSDVRFWPPDPCTFLGDKGCEHGYKDRPRQCRELKPNLRAIDPDAEKRGSCDDGYSKKQAAIYWMPYRDLLDQFNQS